MKLFTEYIEHHRESKYEKAPIYGFKRKITGVSVTVLTVLICCLTQTALADTTGSPRQVLSFNYQWKFTPEDVFYAYYNHTDDSDWEDVTLPHIARVEPLIVNNQWRGRCWYRKHFSIPACEKDKKIFLRFEGAMQIAQVWLNEKAVWTQLGGYLPFVIDITDSILFDKENIIAVRVDNTSNPIVPPGKSLESLDFCYYSGLYRDVTLLITDRLHITGEIAADEIAGGGIFARTLYATDKLALVSVKTHVLNEYNRSRSCKLRAILTNNKGEIVAQRISAQIILAAGQDYTFEQVLEVKNPQLWSPCHPVLYDLKCELIADDRIVDGTSTKIGIRTISFDKDGFRINGKKMFLRGVNRHEQYPYIGNAMSRVAHYRDAKKIKDAGFDYVRLAHYPHNPAFLEACDELGIVVMNCIPGWQYMGSVEFKKLCYKNIRTLIRRDRNHPSVVLWEVSPNETGIHEDYILKSNQIAHEEYPGDQCYTCGWYTGYDVFIQARQHRLPRGLPKISQPYIVSEYGDWEYFVDVFKSRGPEDKWVIRDERLNSRKRRSSGEKGLLRQALNFQQAHNDNLANTAAVADGLWIMFDYNRGYSDDLGACGVMDIFRIPKFSYYFFQSQRDPNIQLSNAKSGPMVYIASYWTEESSRVIKVFSNCEEVALYLNDLFIARKNPDNDANSSHLTYPPFTFTLERFEPGQLKAIGYINDEIAATHMVRTPLEAMDIRLSADISGQDLVADGIDAVFIYASIVDENGTIVVDFNKKVSFSVQGPANIIGASEIAAEAGIATILLRATTQPGTITITAQNGSMQSEPLILESKPSGKPYRLQTKSSEQTKRWYNLTILKTGIQSDG